MRVPRPDRSLHGLAGVVVTSAGYVLAAWARRYGCPVPPWVQALVCCLIAALARESYNWWRGGVWSNADIAWTVLGSVPVIVAAEVKSLEIAP